MRVTTSSSTDIRIRKLEVEIIVQFLWFTKLKIKIFRSKNLHVVQYLLNNNVQTDNRKFYDSPLHTAAENDSYEIAELLLKHNSMLVNALRGENTRLTALHIAAEHGYPATVDVLLRYNAKVSLKCSRGFTALHYAAKSSCEQVIDLILKQVIGIQFEIF